MYEADIILDKIIRSNTSISLTSSDFYTIRNVATIVAISGRKYIAIPHSALWWSPSIDIQENLKFSLHKPK